MFQKLIKIKMNTNDAPEGFKRRDNSRPKREPIIIDTIELSDEDETDREKYKTTQQAAENYDSWPLISLEVKREELITLTERCDEEGDNGRRNTENQEDTIVDNAVQYASPSPGFKSPGCQSIGHVSSGIGSSRDLSPYDDLEYDLALSGRHYQNLNNPKVQYKMTNKTATVKTQERTQFIQHDQMDYEQNYPGFPVEDNSTNNYSFVIEESSQNLSSPQMAQESNIEVYDNSNYNKDHADYIEEKEKYFEEKFKEHEEYWKKLKDNYEKLTDKYEKLNDDISKCVLVPKEKWADIEQKHNKSGTKRRSNIYRFDEKERRISHESRTSTVTSGSYESKLHGIPTHFDYDRDTESSTASNVTIDTSTVEPKQTKYHARKSDASSSNSAQRSHHYHSSSTTSQHRSSNHRSSDRSHSHEENCHSSNALKVPKNVDKNVYLSGNDSRCCPICGKYLKRIVYHFKTVHPEFEVYVSRISPAMVEEAKHTENRGVKYSKRKVSYIKALCLFCGVKRDFMPHYWVDHLRSHTGEYGNQCNLCQKKVSFYTHCSMPTIRNQNEVNLCRNSLYAHMCKKCNFIQIDRENMRKHLLNQHGKNDSIDKYYRKISLMPSMEELPLVPNLDGVQIEPKRNEVCTSAYRRPSSEHLSNDQMKQPSTSGIQVLETQIIRPAKPNSGHEPQVIHKDLQTRHYPSMPIIEEYGAPEYKPQTEQAKNESSPPPSNWKIDAEEEQNLLNLHENYNEITGAFKVSVRPWMDGDYAKKPTINLFTQFALYKCMYERCIFATDNEKQWKGHMLKHIEWIDVLTKRLETNFTKALRDKLIGFRDCSYCGELSKRNIDFIQHMNERHRFCVFQCLHCFYRTNELDNIVLHYENFHKVMLEDKLANVLLCSEQREMEDKDYDLLESYCAENIKKFMCGQVGCKYDFACWNSFYAHVRKNHANVYKCPHCLQTVDTREGDNIKNHLAKHTHDYKRYEIEEFQCIYCNNSEKIPFNHINDIKEHMSHMHPSHFLFVGARQSVNPENDATGDIQIVYVGDMYDHKQYSLYKCRNPDVLNSMDPNELNVERQLEIQRSIVPTMDRFMGLIPIKFNERDNFSYVTYDEYVKYWQSNSRRNQLEYEQEKSDEVTESIQKQKQIIQTIEVKPLLNQCPQSNVEQNVIQVEVQQAQTQRSAPLSPKEINVTYKCISNQTANELKGKANSSYKSQLCKDCLQFVLVDDNNDLSQFINHLMNHRTDESQNICGLTTSCSKSILEHRVKFHSKEAINYLQEEKSESTLVYKLVECKFQCPDCKNMEFKTVSGIINQHHKISHTDRYMHGKIVQEITVIESNDPNQPVARESIIEEQNFQLSHLFCCPHDSCKFSSKKEMLEHHNYKHANQPLEFTLKPFVINYMPITEDRYQMFVFECMHCLYHFDSVDSIHAHIDEIDANHPKKDSGYTMRKLYACAQHNIISTYIGLRMHYLSMHTNDTFIAANIINSKVCGICDIKPPDMKEHIHEHPDYDILNMRSLRKLILEKTDYVNCSFAPECCSNYKFDDLENLLHHISQCPSSNRLICNDCDGITFQNLSALVEHRQNSHDEDLDAILSLVVDFWSPKNLKTLFAKMKIIFKDAKLFTVTLQTIGLTNFGTKFWDKINEKVESIREREKGYISTYSE